MANYVLVPGAGGDPWSWHRVVSELSARGHDAVAVALPAGDDRAGWVEYADAVVAAIGDREEVIVVAHSLGGFTAPIACARAKVDLLVLVNAMIPRPNETGGAWWSSTKASAAHRECLASLGFSAADAQDDDVVYYHDLPPEIAAEARRRPTVQSATPMDRIWPLAAWPPVRTRVLVGRDDRLFPAAMQRRVARERLGIDADEIAGGHMLALSRPRELADRLEAYRRGE